MKVRFTRNILVEGYDSRLGEFWDKYFTKWQEMLVEKTNEQGKFVDLTTSDGRVYYSVPTDSFEVLS